MTMIVTLVTTAASMSTHDIQIMMRSAFFAVLFLYIAGVSAFAPGAASNRATRDVRLKMSLTTDISLDPKEAIKLFGRLAEKYIMLDSTAGMCCYSACSGE